MSTSTRLCRVALLALLAIPLAEAAKAEEVATARSPDPIMMPREPLLFPGVRPLPFGQWFRMTRPDAFVLSEPDIPLPPGTLAGASDEICMAVAIYHEARGESREGQHAVASVILQRAETEGRWGDTPCEVITPGQFSFLSEDGTFSPIGEPEAWEKAIRTARDILRDGPLPELEGADHYHTRTISPRWTRSMDLVARIGAHIFWRDPASAGFSG